MLPLNAQNLASLPTELPVPSYDRARLSTGIVHFGVGGFHRAHQAMYHDRLMNDGEALDWGICGVGVMPADRRMKEVLDAQGGLYTLVVKHPDGTYEPRVIGAIVEYLFAPQDPEAVLEKLAAEATRIVSLTVTEGGYYIDPASQTFDPTHPDIAADAANPRAPKTAFGLILAGLERRRDHGIPPFTVMSCDNIPGNGHVTQNAVVGLAELFDHELAGWVRTKVAFPNGMVDRITPATSQRERDALTEQFGIVDQWPVFCEEFKQWVLEDHFPSGRPALEKVGVQFVDDVAPFEFMKIRILNGGHATIAYPAGLLDIHFVHEAMAEPLIRAFLEKVERDEIIPTVPPVPDTDLGDYYTLIDRRFSNPKIGDTISRLCLDGSNRQPKFILPTALDRVKAGHSVTGLALVSALWARYCYGESDGGKVIPPNDPNWDRLTALARQAKTDPKAWLSMTDIFGELSTNPAYIAAFTTALGSLWSKGTRSTLQAYLSGTL
jgi:mannitol 2-dehydrogenase